jgi:hypothetical protein
MREVQKLGLDLFQTTNCCRSVSNIYPFCRRFLHQRRHPFKAKPFDGIGNAVTCVCTSWSIKSLQNSYTSLPFPDTSISKGPNLQTLAFHSIHFPLSPRRPLRPTYHAALCPTFFSRESLSWRVPAAVLQLHRASLQMPLPFTSFRLRRRSREAALHFRAYPSIPQSPSSKQDCKTQSQLHHRRKDRG